MNLFANEEDADRWFELATRFVVAVEKIAEQGQKRTPAKKRASGEWQETCEAVRSAWNAVAKEAKLSQCRTFNDKDSRNLRARIDDEQKFHKCDKAEALKHVLATIQKVPSQDFACGRTKGSSGRTWKITLQQLLTADKYAKVKNDEYRNDAETTSDAGRVRTGSFLTGLGKKTPPKVGAAGDQLEQRS